MHTSSSNALSFNHLSHIHDYSYYDKRNSATYNRRCIDGHITSCGNCVGYCKYSGHEGFLTAKHRREHDCLGKECFYYLPKVKQKSLGKKTDTSASSIIDIISEQLSLFEGMRAMSAAKNPVGGWIIKYITITNQYPISNIERHLSSTLGEAITLTKLNYDFETAVNLIFYSN